MPSGPKNQLTRQIGEHLVTAELGRRGIIATPFAGNVPEIDLLAYKDGKSIPIQVKAITKGQWQFSIHNFLKVDLKGDRQYMRGIKPGFDRNLICVLVKVNDTQDGYGSDVFYILRQNDLLKYFFKQYFPKKSKSRVRKKNPKSPHCCIWEKDLEKHKGNWDLIIYYS